MEKARWNLDFSLQSPCSLPTYCLLAYPHSASLVCLFHRALELGNISLNKVREFCMKTCPLPCRYISLRYFQIFASPVYPSFESSIILNSSIYNFYGKSENRWFFFFFSNKALYWDRKQLVEGLYFWRIRLGCCGEKLLSAVSDE